MGGGIGPVSPGGIGGVAPAVARLLDPPTGPVRDFSVAALSQASQLGVQAPRASAQATAADVRAAADLVRTSASTTVPAALAAARPEAGQTIDLARASVPVAVVPSRAVRAAGDLAGPDIRFAADTASSDIRAVADAVRMVAANAGGSGRTEAAFGRDLPVRSVGDTPAGRVLLATGLGGGGAGRPETVIERLADFARPLSAGGGQAGSGALAGQLGEAVAALTRAAAGLAARSGSMATGQILASQPEQLRDGAGVVPVGAGPTGALARVMAAIESAGGGLRPIGRESVDRAIQIALRNDVGGLRTPERLADLALAAQLLGTDIALYRDVWGGERLALEATDADAASAAAATAEADSYGVAFFDRSNTGFYAPERATAALLATGPAAASRDGAEAAALSAVLERLGAPVPETAMSSEAPGLLGAPDEQLLPPGATLFNLAADGAWTPVQRF